MLYPLSYGGDGPAYEWILQEGWRGVNRSYIASCIVPPASLT
jgi:hypothetical protein